MVKYLSGLLIAAVLCTSAVAVSAAEMQFCVRNRPFVGAAVVQNSSVSAALDDLLTALGYSWTVSGSNLAIASERGGGPRLSGQAYNVTLDGAAVKVPQTVKDGRVFVDVQQLAKSFSLSYMPSPVLGTIDLMVPISKSKVSGAAWGKKAAAASETSAAAASAAPAAKKQVLNAAGLVETNGSDNKSPIIVVENPWYDSTTGVSTYVGEIRTSCKICNSGDKEVKGVTLVLQVCSLDGQPYVEWKDSIGTMAPGAEVNFVPDPPVWNNYNRTVCKPNIIITHQPIEEDKPAEEAPAAEAPAAK